MAAYGEIDSSIEVFFTAMTPDSFISYLIESFAKPALDKVRSEGDREDLSKQLFLVISYLLLNEKDGYSSQLAALDEQLLREIGVGIGDLIWSEMGTNEVSGFPLNEAGIRSPIDRLKFLHTIPSVSVHTNYFEFLQGWLEFCNSQVETGGADKAQWEEAAHWLIPRFPSSRRVARRDSVESPVDEGSEAVAAPAPAPVPVAVADNYAGGGARERTVSEASSDDDFDPFFSVGTPAPPLAMAFAPRGAPFLPRGVFSIAEGDEKDSDAESVASNP